jgi:regulator of G-protein signaling
MVAVFRKFLCQEHSEENLDFWLACERFKAAASEDLTQLARDICGQFVADRAPRQVNLSCLTRTQVLEGARAGRPTAALFAKAQSRIHTLMENDSYPRFLASPLYAEAHWAATSSD